MSDKYGDYDAARERDMDREVEEWFEQQEVPLIKLNFDAIGWVYAENYPLYELELESGETYNSLTQAQLLKLSQRLNLDLRVASR